MAADVTERTQVDPGAYGRIKKTLISIALAVTLAAIFVANMPASTIKTQLMVAAQPCLNALGIGQDWGVFSPNPRRQIIYSGGLIAYSDGSASIWNFPMRPGIMAYSDYRWQKFEEHVRLDNFKGLWQPFSQYLVTHVATPGKKPVQVALIRRWADIQPPASGVAQGPWSQTAYYVANVEGAR
jgi:hypothetical protein